MAIRLKIDGMDIETDSPGEAVELYRLLSKTKFNGPGQKNATNEEKKSAGAEPAPALSDLAQRMLRHLLTKRDGEKKETLAQIIGVNGTKGLASPTRQIRVWG